MPRTFRESFEEMLDALRAHPKIEVLDAVIRPPAGGGDIRDAEALIGRKLPDEIIDFYLAHDGVYLAWGLRGREYGSSIEPFGWPDYGTPPGVINLLPMSEVFSSGWVSDYTINWTADDHRVIYGDDPPEDDKHVRAVLVDFYSKFHHADLVFGPPDRPVWALIADDHGAELMESNLSSFTTYLDIVIARWGLNRMPAYKVERYRQPKEIKVPAARLTLDEALADAETDE